jgi:uncharacterized protein YndB with AHSA1/START domain
MSVSVGPMHVRRSVYIEAAPARVWQEFSSAERIGKWLDQGHELIRIEPRLGGKVEFSVSVDSTSQLFGGEVTVFADAQEMSFSINWHDDFASPVDTFWTFRLTATYSGTMVELFHHGFERLGAGGADALQGYEEGWTVKHLSTLRDIVEG